MTKTPFPAGSVLGYPRIGPRRELKKSIESFWAGRSTAEEVEAVAADLRRRTRNRLVELGLPKDVPAIPSAFSFYDQVLDATAVVGAVPARFADVVGADGSLDLAGYSTVARGRGDDLPARDDQVVRHQLPLPRPGDRPRDDVPLRERPSRAGVRGGARGRRPHSPRDRRSRSPTSRWPRPPRAPRPTSRRSTASRTCCPSTPSSCRSSPPPAPPGSSWRSPRWSPTRSRSPPSSCSPRSSRRTAPWPPT